MPGNRQTACKPHRSAICTRSTAPSSSGFTMKKPKNRSGHAATALSTEASSPGTLAISAARATPCPSSSAAHGAAQFRRIFRRQHPAGGLGHLLGRLARLRTQGGEELSGKKVNVRVGDREVTPGSLHRVCSSG